MGVGVVGALQLVGSQSVRSAACHRVDSVCLREDELHAVFGDLPWGIELDPEVAIVGARDGLSGNDSTVRSSDGVDEVACDSVDSSSGAHAPLGNRRREVAPFPSRRHCADLGSTCP